MLLLHDTCLRPLNRTNLLQLRKAPFYVTVENSLVFFLMKHKTLWWYIHIYISVKFFWNTYHVKCPFLGDIHALCLSKTESEIVLGSSFFLFIVIRGSRGARINKSILMIADCFRAKNDKTHVKREGIITLEIKVSVSV